MSFKSTSVSLLIAAFSIMQAKASVIYEERPADEWKTVLKLASRMDLTSVSRKASKDISGIPYTSYLVDPVAIASNQLLSSVKPWRLNYLIFRRGDLIGSYQISPDLKGIEVFQEGAGIAADFWEALQLAKTLKATKSRDYILRFLDSPPLLFVALWLHADSDDIIIPIGNSFGRWSGFKAYSASKFSRILSHEAKKLLTPKPPAKQDGPVLKMGPSAIQEPSVEHVGFKRRDILGALEKVKYYLEKRTLSEQCFIQKAEYDEHSHCWKIITLSSRGDYMIQVFDSGVIMRSPCKNTNSG